MTTMFNAGRTIKQASMNDAGDEWPSAPAKRNAPTIATMGPRTKSEKTLDIEMIEKIEMMKYACGAAKTREPA